MQNLLLSFRYILHKAASLFIEYTQICLNYQILLDTILLFIYNK